VHARQSKPPPPHPIRKVRPVSTAANSRQPLLSAPLRGVLWMTLAAAVFSVLNGLIRFGADQGLHPFQIGFLRSVFGLLFMLPWILRGGVGGLKTQRWRFFIARGLLATGGVLCWMSAVAAMPIAEATSISFVAPLFATAGSALLLGETVRLRRWSAIIVGFIGVLIMLRPGYAVVGVGAFWAVGAAGFMACSALAIKSLTRTEPTDRIVTWTALVLSCTTLPPALAVWTPMTTEFLLLAVLLGLLGTLGHLALTRAFAVADASFVMPFDYARLPFAALVGYMFFAELPDKWTWVGALVITGAAVYVARREALLARPQTALKPSLLGRFTGR